MELINATTFRRKNIYKVSVVLNFTMLLSFNIGCHRGQSDSTRVAANDSEVLIRQWDLFGPFSFSPEDISPNNPRLNEGGLNKDYLRSLGLSENNLSMDDLVRLRSKASFRTYNPSGIVTPLDQIFKHASYQVIYAITLVKCSSATETALEIGSEDGVKIWINNRLVIATSNQVNRAAFKNTDVVKVHLKKGTNLLVAKVDRKAGAWDLIASFVNLKQAEATACTNAHEHFLKTHLLQSGDLIRVQLPALCTDKPSYYYISDIRGQAIARKSLPHKQEFEISTAHIEPGYYTLTLIGLSHTYTDSFYKGSISKIYRRLLRQQLFSTNYSDDHYSRDAVLMRYQILESSHYRQPTNSDWQKKILYVLEEACASLDTLAGKHWTQRSGLHLREYQSALDGELQNYALYIPHRRTAAAMPLVVILPFAEAPLRPFLESTLIAWPDSLENTMRAAEQQGFAVAIANGRGSVGVAPIGESDILEMIRNIEDHFNISTNQIYLYGVCEGGWRALMLAEHYPHDFAAVATYGPLLHGPSPSPIDVIWRQENDISRNSGNLITLPLLLTKGQYDSQPPTSEFIQFGNRLRRRDVEIDMKIIPDGIHKMNKLEESLFPFYKGKFAASSNTVTTGASSDFAGKRLGYPLELRKHALLRMKFPGNQKIEIRSRGIDTVLLQPQRLGFERGSSILVDWNGVKFRRVATGRPITFERGPSDTGLSDLAQGRFVDLFAEPFIVVGSRRSDIASLNAFVQMWKGMFFVPPKIVDESQVTQKDLKSYNILLMGVPTRGTFLGRAIRRLPFPFPISGSKLQLDSPMLKAYQFAVLYENPLRREKFLGIVHFSSHELLSNFPGLPVGGYYRAAWWSDHGDLMHVLGYPEMDGASRQRK